jgi:hypothetical protein
MFTGSNSEEVAGISRGSDPMWLSLGFRARETLRVSTRRVVNRRVTQGALKRIVTPISPLEGELRANRKQSD